LTERFRLDCAGKFSDYPPWSKKRPADPANVAHRPDPVGLRWGRGAW